MVAPDDKPHPLMEAHHKYTSNLYHTDHFTKQKNEEMHEMTN